MGTLTRFGRLVSRNNEYIFGLKKGLHSTCPRTNPPNHQPGRLFNKIRDSVLLLEARQGPFGKTLLGIGQGLGAGILVFGAGAGVHYTFSPPKSEEDLESGLSLDQLNPDASTFPDYAQTRVHTTYMYLMNSLGISALGAAASFRLIQRTRLLDRVLSRNPLPAIGFTMAIQFLVTMIVSRLPYEEGFGIKQMGSIVQGALIGLTAGPMYLFGAQSIVRAGFITAGIVGGLTGISAIVPHDAFVKWERPCHFGMHAVFLAFMSLWFIPAHLPLYRLMYRVAMQGGLVIFPAYYLYNSKAVVRSAMLAPHFDPINASMAMYMDVLNVYGRLAYILPPPYFMAGDARPKFTRTVQSHSQHNDSK